MVKYDKYSLAHIGPFHLDGHKEMSIMFELDPQSSFSANFTGSVYDSLCCHSIEAATVRIYNADEKLLSQRKTNGNGEFLFECLKRGRYFVTVSAEGYLLTELQALEIKENKINRMDFFLKRNPLETSGIIYGKVLDADCCGSIKNGEVVLIDEHGKLYAKTCTNEDGQFLFYNIQPGNYFIFANHPKYKKSLYTYYMVKQGGKIRLNFSLRLKRDKNRSVDGKVLGQSGVPDAHLPVFLFSVNQGCEKLIKTQLTNGKGLFYFDNLQAGDYIVKAQLSDGKSFLENYSI